MGAMRVLTICHGNICRSPMAAMVLADALRSEGLDAEVISAGVSAEESGNPIDPRARRTLERHGIPVTDHVARQVTAADLADADLVIAMTPGHLRQLDAINGAPVEQAVLLTSFDPDAEPGAAVPDPWYGDESDFEDTLAAIRAALPGMVSQVRAED